MKQLILYTLIVTLVVGCGERSSDKAESTNENITKAEGGNKYPLAVKDTLQYYLRQNEKLPSGLYQRIFGHELSDIDKAYVQAIKMPVQSFIPVIVAFKTVESDRESEYIDLHLFDDNWALKKSLSLDYEIPYDLFRQKHQFISDSILEIRKREGLSYDNDSAVETILTLRFNEEKIFDTIGIHLDTIY